MHSAQDEVIVTLSCMGELEADVPVLASDISSGEELIRSFRGLLPYPLECPEGMNLDILVGVVCQLL